MLNHLLLAYIMVGLLTFALRAALPDLPIPAWGPMLGYAFLVGIGYGIHHLVSLLSHPIVAAKTMNVWRIHRGWNAHHPA